MKRIHLYVVVAIGSALALAQASEWPIPKLGLAIEQNLNSFEGTFATLPSGFAVSKDAVNIMTSDDEDFRGIKDPAATTGGCYAWKLADNNYSLGYQPTADEFTPGFFLAVVSNTTGHAVREMTVSYTVVCRNNENRSASIDLQYSLDGTSYDTIAAARFVSPEEEDSTPLWEQSSRTCVLNPPTPLGDGTCVWFRWYVDDLAGTGSRDEIGIDNVHITFHPPKGTVIFVK
jgi:hypothetical protein